MIHSASLLRRAAIFAALVLLSVSCSHRIPDTKKGIMDAFVAGTLDPSYAPAAFFIHFGPDQKVGDSAVQAHLDYFHASGMDLLKVQFEQTVPRIRELKEGAFEFIPEDFYRPTLEIIAKLQEAEGKDVYVLPTVYSPYQVAHHSLGERRIRAAAVEQPELLKAVFDSYRDALLWLVKECKKAGILGFYMCTQGGELTFYDIPGFFDNFVRPYDMAVMGECTRDTKMNILHICNWEGPYDDLTRYKDYPAQIVNTPTDLNGVPFSLTDGIGLFGRPVLGGFDREGEFNTLSADGVATEVHAILRSAPAGKVMIGADCTVGSAPLANIQAAVAAAHGER
jgi:uroporphyrinogen decarboxylase